MLFTSAILALTAWQSFASAAAVESGKGKDAARQADKHAAQPAPCVQAKHLHALGNAFHNMKNGSSFQFHSLPAVPQKFSEDDCLPESLIDLYVEPTAQLAKEQNFYEKYFMDVEKASPAHGLTRRIRDIPSCAQSQDNAYGQISQWSCNSASNPDKCRHCASLAAVAMTFSCLSCAAKMNYESPFCCMASAASFVFAYSHVCLTSI